MAGSVVMMIILPESMGIMTKILLVGTVLNTLMIFKEVLMPHDTPDTKKAIHLMTKGYYSKYFWFGVTFGNIASAVVLLTFSGNWVLLAGGMALVGIYLTEYVRIRVPQMIPLS
jgi:uncharacterized membrane protein YobD (UPF0266 family)